MGEVGLWLVVVIITDIILDGVIGEEAPHLLVELGRQGLVVAEDEGGSRDVLDDVGDGEGLAGARDAEEHLGAVAPQDAVGELSDGLGLVARGLVF